MEDHMYIYSGFCEFVCILIMMPRSIMPNKFFEFKTQYFASDILQSIHQEGFRY